ncbi:MFS transporter [Actinoplanes sp. NPDC049316]|uniref:MFS transporter n=1 Tax=Actinoplanes sp. NPDC049316 TaxID=3154727 RepID=UPI003442B243
MKAVIARLLPATSAGRRMVLVALVDSTGTGVFLAGSVVFLTRVAELSASQIGLGLSAAGVAGLLATMPIGMLADRYGERRTLVVLQLWRGAWFLAYAYVGNFLMFVVIACAMALAEKATGPLNQAVVGAAAGTQDRVHIMASIRVVRNVGFSAGAAAGTALVGLGSHTGFRAVILSNAVSFFLAAFLLGRVPLAGAVRARLSGSWPRPRALRDLRYLTLTGLNAVLVVHMTILSVGIPLWIVTRTTVPPAMAGIAVLINTVVVVLFQVRASRGCDSLPVAAVRMRWSGLALAGCCAVLAVSAGTGLAVGCALVAGAVLLQTAGEMWQSAGSWTVSYDLAPAERRAEYLSAFSLGSTVQSIVGPVLLTSIVVRQGAVGWLGLGALLLGAGLLMPVLTTRAAAVMTELEGSAR